MGVGGTIEPAWEQGSPRWFPHEFNWTVGCTYPGLPTAPASIPCRQSGFLGECSGFLSWLAVTCLLLE